MRTHLVFVSAHSAWCLALRINRKCVCVNGGKTAHTHKKETFMELAESDLFRCSPLILPFHSDMIYLLDIINLYCVDNWKRFSKFSIYLYNENSLKNCIKLQPLLLTACSGGVTEVISLKQL